MAQLSEAEDFLRFCLERADELTRRDWLASLTLLTMRRRLSTSHPLFRQYSQRLLQDESAFKGSVHLVLHRYGVLGYAPAVWKLLPLLQARLPLMRPKDVAVSAWSLGRTLVNDRETWEAMGQTLAVGEWSLPDLAMFAWALAAIDRAVPAEVVALKRAVRGCGALGESQDLVMLLRAVSRLTPGDRRFLEWLLLLLAEGMVSRQMSFTAQGLASVWGSLAQLGWEIRADFLEALCEESRALRLDHTFNQDMAAEIAKALLRLGVEDARPTYQITEFVARRGLALRADTLLILAEFMAARNVDSEIAWRRLGVRAQQRGVDLRLAEIDRLVLAFRRAGRGNQRIYGMLQLFVRLREDQARYGAA